MARSEEGCKRGGRGKRREKTLIKECCAASSVGRKRGEAQATTPPWAGGAGAAWVLLWRRCGAAEVQGKNSGLAVLGVCLVVRGGGVGVLVRATKFGAAPVRHTSPLMRYANGKNPPLGGEDMGRRELAASFVRILSRKLLTAVVMLLRSTVEPSSVDGEKRSRQQTQSWIASLAVEATDKTHTQDAQRGILFSVAQQG